MFVPYLEQHKTLTPEDEKLYAEIMATESDWFVPDEDKKAGLLICDCRLSRRYKSDDENTVIDAGDQRKMYL